MKKLISFSVHGWTEKIAGLWFDTWVSAQPETLPNVTILVGSLKSQNLLFQP